MRRAVLVVAGAVFFAGGLVLFHVGLDHLLYRARWSCSGGRCSTNDWWTPLGVFGPLATIGGTVSLWLGTR
jgi:hypothetical protein